jgi:diguanylate cyclase (GGDEF)-like protein/PAS domain S-box-containing protein
MLNKNDFYYDLEIETCDIDEEVSFIAYYTKKSNFLYNYTTMVQDINKKTLYLKNEEQHKDKKNHYNEIINQRLVTFNVDTQGTVIDVNDTCAYFFGLEKKQMVGKHFSNFIKAREDNLDNGKIFKAINHNGEEVFFHTDIIPISKDDEVYENIIICQDITYLKKIQEDLIYAANHDSLTGLANRSLLLEKIDEAVKNSKENNSSFALCFIDLNKFKAINDTYGHHAGDLLLQHLAKILTNFVRDEDIAARVGGDEFVILIRNIQNKENAKVSMQRIHNAIINSPLVYEGRILKLSCSLGVSVFPDDATNPDSLLKVADKEMYMDKQTYRC